MKYQVKPYEVPRGRPRKVAATAAPKSLPAFNVEASSDAEARRIIHKRYEQQGRNVRSLNAISEYNLVVYVEAK